jgi:hypothetical protein
MAQDPDDPDESLSAGDVDLSHESGMSVLYDSLAANAELNADNIVGVLQTNGIDAMIKRSSPYPNLGVMVLVAKSDLERAKTLIDEALAAGPDAAADAEAQSELP